ncbi:MAG: serine hydrolase [Marinoscillum sp.]
MKTLHLIFLFISTLTYGQEGYQYSPPQLMRDGWSTIDLRSLKVDTSRVYQLFNQLKQGNHQLHSVLLVKDDKLCIEEYFNANAINQPHDLRSATKSIRSLLLGIAIDKGFIDHVDDPISKYLKTPVPKKNSGNGKEQITIRHLLTMSSGLDCNDWDKKSKGQEDKVYKKKDWLQYTLDLPMINEPGTVSNYCSMGVVLLAELISQSSGMSIDQFAETYLFGPLNISNVSWGHTSNKEVIPSAKRLYLTSRDMAKIGQMVLNKGSWNGEQIVTEKWIKESTSAKTQITGIDYGYLWWSIPFKVDDRIIEATVATGNGGQYIMIINELNMVAVFTGGAYNSQEDKLPFAILKDIFLSMFLNGL